MVLAVIVSEAFIFFSSNPLDNTPSYLPNQIQALSQRYEFSFTAEEKKSPEKLLTFFLIKLYCSSYSNTEKDNPATSFPEPWQERIETVLQAQLGWLEASLSFPVPGAFQRRCFPTTWFAFFS